MDRAEEAQLATQLLAREPAAFEAFARHFGGKIFHYSWLMCGQREDAEEVAQETLMRVFESLDQLREPALVRPWVFRIAKNVCLMKRRRSLFAPQPGQELSLDHVMPAKVERNGEVRLEIADWSQVPEQQAISAELREMLEDAIRALPSNYRSVVLLRDIEQLNTKETAEILDLAEDVVKQRLHRGRLALRKALDGQLKGLKHGRG